MAGTMDLSEFNQQKTMERMNRTAGKNNLKMLTMNDAKVLGKYTKKLEKTMPATQFSSRAFKTIKSNYTPRVNKASNEQIFNERRELVSNWFEIWNDSQRKRFLDVIFRQCKKSQLRYIQRWFGDHVPLQHLDFTRVLPRFLSLYIFSFLDPRSLSRASSVCWNWKFLTEQDYLWIPKCLKRGWFLPYEPADNEYGAWKRHYVACLHTMEVDVLSKNVDLVDDFLDSETYGGIGDGTGRKHPRDKKRVLSLKESREVLEIRPEWQPPDRIPRDLERSAKALAEGYNPNDPVTPRALLLHHNKWGVPRTKLSASTPDLARLYAGPNRDPNQTVLNDYTGTTKKMKTVTKSLDALDLTTGRKNALSESLQVETFEERRLMELVAKPWDPNPPAKLAVTQTPKIAGTASYPLPWKHQTSQPMSKAYLNERNPRVLFLSSRVPAADVLVDAINFGVIPIVYEYEGTTLQSLITRLDRSLQGRNAKSIGLFAHSETPEVLNLVHGATVTVDNLDTPDFVEFFTSLASHVLPETEKGHIDVFVPLGSTEAGMEMLIQLNILTGVQFTSPTGIIGNYNHVNSEWSRGPQMDCPPSLYFCNSKLNVWANTADQVKEACRVTKGLIGRYFEQKHRDVVSQLTGQIIFDATGQVDIMGVDLLTNTLVDGLVELGIQQNEDEENSNVKPLEFLGKYILEQSGQRVDEYLSTSRTKQKAGDTLMMAPTMDSKTLTAALNLDEKFEESLQSSTAEEVEADAEVADINGLTPSPIPVTEDPKMEKEKSNMEAYEEKLAKTLENEEEESHHEGEEEEREIEEGIMKKPKPKSRTGKTVTLISNPEYYSASTLTSMMADDSRMTGTLTTLTETARPMAHSTMRNTIPRRLTAKQFAGHPEKRTPIAKEVLSSETEYMRTLDIIASRFHMPIRAALSTNRAIISAHNSQIIFSDIITILDISRELTEELKARVIDWTPQHCLGDIFVKFCSKLKAYVNFLNNYPLILSTIERCMEQTPLFRAFLKRHERQPESKMLTLPELFLTATRRIGEYVTLLTWLHTYTPPDHADRNDLETAIRRLRNLDKHITETKERAEKERELSALQNKIIRCPLLLEANRYFLRQLDVAHLKEPSDSILPELRVYQHIEMLGLFLFNDSLVVTRRTSHNFPFERAVEYNYRFEACASLARLRVDDIPDSKYVKNAYCIYTPRRSWTCACDSADDKSNWVSLLENTVRACLATK